MPRLWPENFEAWELWKEIETQWRAGPVGVIGLDYREVRERARELDIDLSPALWKKIKALEALILKRS